MEGELRKRHPNDAAATSKGQSNNTSSSSTAAATSTATISQADRIRQGIVQQNKKERLEQRRIARLSHAAQTSVQKIYLALIMNIILVVMGGLIYWKPEVFFQTIAKSRASGNGKTLLQWPPHHLAVLFPPQTRLKTDLPKFFQQYAIATPENYHARQAVRQLLKVRSRLKPFQIFVTAWEREGMMSDYPVDDYCGTGFSAAYQYARTTGSLREPASVRHAEDLLVWCLLHTYQNDGFYQWNSTLERAPISASLTATYSQEDTLKGMVPRRVGENRIHPSFLWLPKKREIATTTTVTSADGEETTTTTTREDDAEGIDAAETTAPETTAPAPNIKTTTKTTFDMNSQVPARMLPWLIHTAPKLPTNEYARASEEFLHNLIMTEEEHWMILDAVCNSTVAISDYNATEYEHRRVMGKDCLWGEAGSDSNNDADCCTVYMPKGDTTMVNRRLRRHVSSSDSKD